MALRRLRYPLSLLAVLVLGSQAPAATLIHEYTFDGSTVTDSVGTENGLLLNGATVAGGTLNLDGSDDYVQFGSYLVATGVSYSITLSAREDFAPGLYAELISQGGPNFYLGHDPSQNIRAGDNWISPGVPYPSIGAWHDFALTFDGSTATLYIDGVFKASSAISAINPAGDATRLGRQFDGHAEYFPGQIDNVRIYSGALTAAEVPEPSTIAAVSMLLALGVARRPRK